MSNAAVNAAIRRVLLADTTSFTELVQIARLDPVQSFRHRNLSGVDFSGLDLSGYDFEGANLSGARFAGAVIGGANFKRARITRAQLRQARDWLKYSRANSQRKGAKRAAVATTTSASAALRDTLRSLLDRPFDEMLAAWMSAPSDALGYEDCSLMIRLAPNDREVANFVLNCVPPDLMSDRIVAAAVRKSSSFGAALDLLHAVGTQWRIGDRSLGELFKRADTFERRVAAIFNSLGYDRNPESREVYAAIDTAPDYRSAVLFANELASTRCNAAKHAGYRIAETWASRQAVRFAGELLAASHSKLPQHIAVRIMYSPSSFNEANEIFDELLRLGVSETVELYNALLWHANQMTLAEQIASHMRDRAIPLDEVTYALLVACADSWERAVGYFNEMDVSGVRKSAIIYRSMLRISRNVDDVLRMLIDMKHNDVQATKATYSDVLDRVFDLSTLIELLPYMTSLDHAASDAKIARMFRQHARDTLGNPSVDVLPPMEGRNWSITIGA